MTDVRIICLTLLPAPPLQSYSVQLPQGKLEWEMRPVEPDSEAIRQAILEAQQCADAVALEGLSCTFQIAGRQYLHDQLWQALNLHNTPGVITDGVNLRASLERYLVRQAADLLKPKIRDKHILFFSGLNRYGSAEVIDGYSKHVVFGDLLYGFRLGIPINSFSAFINSAPQLVKAVGQTPASWYWPSARRNPRLMPRFQYYFRTADVIVGDLAYFLRYAPPKLPHKVVFTTLTSSEDIAWFREREVDTLISLTPQIDGQLVPLAVLDAALTLYRNNNEQTAQQDLVLEQIQELDPKPLIVELRQAEESDYALAQLPKKPLPELQPRELDELVAESPGDTARFAFVIHPLTFQHVKRLPIMRTLSSFVPQRLLEDAIAQANPFPVGALRNVSSATGATAEGLIYAVPMTSKAIMRFPPEMMYRKLEQVAEAAAHAGCKLMGLGAYTSVAGDAGETVAGRVGIGVTTGNSYTVAMTLRALRQAAQRCGVNMRQAHGLVIGATGSIGTICARLLAAEVDELSLVSPRPERLLALASLLLREQPQLQGRLHVSRYAADCLGRADVIITTTSAVDPIIDVALLKPGCVVCDVARPPDIKPEAAARRDDVLVIESGEILLPAEAQLTCDIGLPPGTIYACMAETLILALDHRFGHYTLGREIDKAKVLEIEALGDKHGLCLSAIRSFDQVVTEERFTRLAEINASRFSASSADSPVSQ